MITRFLRRAALPAALLAATTLGGCYAYPTGPYGSYTYAAGGYYGYPGYYGGYYPGYVGTGLFVGGWGYRGYGGWYHGGGWGYHGGFGHADRSDAPVASAIPASSTTNRPRGRRALHTCPATG